jgi:phenylalanyl-tRNA synthetase beta chain
MKFTLSWLKDHLETDASVDEIALALTRLGLEVESVDNPGAKLAAFRIAHVIEAVPHPNADKLRVCTVDTGDGVVQVVCGAPNARTGMKAVLGRPGDYVPGLDVTLREAEIRGVKSFGMMCSARELQLGDDHEGILDLPADAPVGAAYADWAGLSDPLIDIAVTPNRQDCLGVAGVARDLAAAGVGTLISKSFAPVAGTFANPVPIRLEDAQGCPAFAGQVVRGVRNGPSPAWLQQRLRAIGLRPISALVDITQYIMIDRARPLHVYDLAKLSGAIRARRGKPGETLEALNGKTYEADARMLVIADDVQALGFGGIMGGTASGCTEATTDVFIECAHFDPAAIAKSGMALGLTSDARSRFERGVDPASLDEGLGQATRLILELCGGAPSEVTIAGAAPIIERSIDYDPERVQTLGGMSVPELQQAAILVSLGFAVTQGRPWQVQVPSWRRDVDGAADLVEEVLRLAGYDHIPAVALPRPDGVARPTATPMQSRLKRLRRMAAARGFAEAITWSFIAPDEAAPFGGGVWTLENPISADLAVMRPSLLPGLVRAAACNMARGAQSVRLFEIGKRYLPQTEADTLALVGAGLRWPKHWSTGKASRFDVFDAKAEALALLAAIGVPVDRIQISADAPEWFHPGRSGVIRLGPKTALATFGELHPAVLKALDAKGPVMAIELFADGAPWPKASGRRARPAFTPPSLQPVERDFAFVVGEDVEAARLIAAIRGAEKALIREVALFDQFTGEGVPDGSKSLAVAVTLQPLERTLTDADLDALTAKVVAAAAKACGAALRG